MGARSGARQAEPGLELFGRHGLAEQEALCVVAAGLQQQVALRHVGDGSGGFGAREKAREVAKD